MGREIKRVALSFVHPIGEVWPGYINPHYVEQVECPECKGSGYSREAKRLYDQWYGYVAFSPEMTGSTPILPDDPRIRAHAERSIDQMGVGLLVSFYGTADRHVAVLRECYRLIGMFNGQWIHHIDQDDVNALVEADRLWDFTRVPRTAEQKEIVKAKLAGGGNSWLPENNGYIPTAREVNEWALFGFGHDSINCGICVRAKCARLGYAVHCAACDGEGHVRNPELEARIEAWQETEPPEGEGWQVWETVSEGSPISPVFPDAESCVTWLVTDQGYSPQSARAFVSHGWAPSAMMVEGVGVWDGVTGLGINEALAREHTTR